MTGSLSSLVLAGACLARLALASLSPMTCRPVSFLITTSAQNVNFATPPDPTNGTAIIAWYQEAAGDPSSAPTDGTNTVGGTFHIAGTYCQPRGRVRNVIQVLIHGATYSKSYWTGLGLADEYNWPRFAARRGYATLSIDRVGHGGSTPHLDPVQGEQVNIHTEVVHKIITSIKGVVGNPLGRRFHQVIVVGHSYGTTVGTALAAAHGGDIDAYVATGFSTTLDIPTSVTLALDVADAKTFLPLRFGALPPGYMVFQHESVRENAFYAGAYDPAVASYDFSVQETTTPGELLVQGVAFAPVVGFTAPVMVVTGAEDHIYCNPNQGDCNTLLAASSFVFPDTVNYAYYAPPSTGHDIVLHYSAPTTFTVVHNWLDGIFGP